jgi:hypothetical protein
MPSPPDDRPDAIPDPKAPSLEVLRAEAAYTRDRLALYRMRVNTGKPTTERRLRELERAAASAQDRLRRATAK